MTDKSILKRLETEEPSKELDGLLAIGYGWTYRDPPLISLSGWKNPDGREDWLPHFTARIDVALPNENIVYSIWTKPDGWLSKHRSPIGIRTPGTNPYSEAMARRAAAWKARTER